MDSLFFLGGGGCWCKEGIASMDNDVAKIKELTCWVRDGWQTVMQQALARPPRQERCARTSHMLVQGMLLICQFSTAIPRDESAMRIQLLCLSHMNPRFRRAY